MTTLFPEEGNGSAALIRDLMPALDKSGIETSVLFASADQLTTSMPSTRVFKTEQQLVFQANMAFPTAKRFVEANEGEINRYVKDLESATIAAFADFSPAIIHVHHAWFGVIVAEKIQQMNGIPFLVHIHGTELDTLSAFEIGAPWQKQLFNLVMDGIAKAKNVICTSESQRTLWNSFFQNRQVDVDLQPIPGGVDNSTFSYANCNFAEDEEPEFIFVGRLIEEKGVLDLLDAFPEVLKTHNNAKLSIYGNGPLASQIADQIAPFRSAIILHGFIEDRSKLAAIYRRSRALCMPSYNEPFGLVAAEALACGTPLIAYNSGALPDFFGEMGLARTGTLIPPGNKKELARALVNEMEKDEREETRRARARRAAEIYSIDSCAQKFGVAYRSE